MMMRSFSKCPLPDISNVPMQLYCKEFTAFGFNPLHIVIAHVGRTKKGSDR
jgi:hypothetical protein